MVSIYLTELVAVIFVWKVQCEMHKSTCNHVILLMVNVLIYNFAAVIAAIH